MNVSFDPNKPVQTRSGNKARIICTDSCNKKFPIVALITAGGEEIVASFSSNGSYTSGGCDSWDLVNIPEEAHKYVNVYAGRCGMIHDDLGSARARADASGLKATIKITYINGDISGVELV